jgi:hypothetical protein
MLCIRVGGFQPPGQKQNGRKLYFSFQATAGSLFFQRIKQFPQEWVQGGHRPGGVRGKAPLGSPHQIPISHLQDGTQKRRETVWHAANP